MADETLNVFEFQFLCRICLKKSTEMHQIFEISDDKEDFSKNHMICDKISFCTGLQLTLNDGLPQQICNQCFTSLISYHDFKTVTLLNDSKLKLIFNREQKKEFNVKLEFTPGDIMPIKKDVFDQKPDNFEYNFETTLIDDFTDFYDDGLNDDYDIKVEKLDVIKDITKKETSKDSINQIFSKCPELSIKKVSTNPIKEKKLKHKEHKTIKTLKIPKGTKLRVKKMKMTGKKVGRPRKYKLKDLARPIQLPSVFSCEYCKKKFDNEKEASIHKKTHKVMKVIYEKGCVDEAGNILPPKPKVKKEKLKKPEQSNEPRVPKVYVYKKKKIVCEYCGKIFDRGTNHTQHLQTHMKPKFKCDLCDHRTYSKSSLQKHIVIHSDLKIHHCVKCPKSFKTLQYLRTHERRVHVPKTRDYDCEYCHKKYYFKENLRLHIATKHEVDERHTCEVCHEGFKVRQSWRKHMLNKHDIVVPLVKPSTRKRNFVVDN